MLLLRQHIDKVAVKLAVYPGCTDYIKKIIKDCYDLFSCM